MLYVAQTDQLFRCLATMVVMWTMCTHQSVARSERAHDKGHSVTPHLDCGSITSVAVCFAALRLRARSASAWAEAALNMLPVQIQGRFLRKSLFPATWALVR